MNNTELFQMADIFPPPVQAASVTDYFLLVFIILALSLIIAFFYLRLSAQRLKRLSNQFQQQKIAQRQCAFLLSRLLHEQKPSSPQQNTKVWDDYALTLQVACFSREGLNRDAMVQLLRDAKQWLA